MTGIDWIGTLFTQACSDGKHSILYQKIIGNAFVDAEGNLRGFDFGPVAQEEVELRVAA